MMTRKLFVVLAVFLVLCMRQTIKAQTNNSIVPILLNEYSASNIGTPVDNYGQQSDWVELYNAHTAPVSLNGYYLSNDRYNLYKWKFPNTFVMGVGSYAVVWLSGRGTSGNGNYHANFTLDQCKNQWLILTSPNGVIRDSVFVQKTKEGHSWGRVDPAVTGVSAWRLYTAHSFLFANPLINNYKGYAPKPTITVASAGAPTSTFIGSPNTGSFIADPASLVFFKLENPFFAYDTTFHSCYNVYYTTDGSYPVVGGLNTTQVLDSNVVVVLDKATIIRAISVINPTSTVCGQDYLPSFCETNTYFTDPDYNSFNSDYGVLSIAMEDTSWFLSNGLPPNSRLHVEYYDNKKQVCEGYALMNRPPNEAWLTTQKGFNITIDDKQGFGCNFEGNIFNVQGLGVTSRTVFPTLQLYAGDNESHSPPGVFGAATPTSFGTGIRDVFIQTLSAKYNLNVNPLHMKPVQVFRNGKYWGMYTLKEVYDKYYETYYHQQSKDSLDLAYYYNTDGFISYGDGSVSRFTPPTSFKSGVYDIAVTQARPLTGPYYTAITNALDTSSLIDYFIVNSYVLNSDLWKYNIAFARGGQSSKPGHKWHYYLWNMPTIFTFSSVVFPSNSTYSNASFPICSIYNSDYAVSPSFANNGHAAIMRRLFLPKTGNTGFQTAYMTRYQDVANSAFKCENILKHFDYVYGLYTQGMKYHELPGSNGSFSSAENIWDTNMVRLRKVIEQRCQYIATNLGKGCIPLVGPYGITVNVEPAGAGSVKLNTIYLDSYPWTGSYYAENMSLKAMPTNTTFVFDHWEFKNNHVLDNRPLSLDSVAIMFALGDEITAVFTDKTTDLASGVNVPTGFTPNGDGRNDTFGPLGAGKFESDYEMTVWNRWGQEVYRSVSPLDQWDGYYKGQQALTGVYAYIIKYKNVYGEDKLLKGNVTLTR